MGDNREHAWSIPETWRAAAVAIALAAPFVLIPATGLWVAMGISGGAFLLTVVLLLVCRKVAPGEVTTDERDKRIAAAAARAAGRVFFLIAFLSCVAAFVVAMAQGKKELKVPIEMLPVGGLIGCFLFAFVKAIAILAMHARERGHAEE